MQCPVGGLLSCLDPAAPFLRPSSDRSLGPHTVFPPCAAEVRAHVHKVSAACAIEVE